jgi:hypothetical protein
MSYTGVGIVGSHVAHEATAHHDSGMVAARDIVRRNTLGQQVVVVPAGRPIPAGMDTAVGEAVPAARPDTPHVEYHHRPEPYLTGPERQNLFRGAKSAEAAAITGRRFHHQPNTPHDPAVSISPSSRSLPDGMARCPRCERDLPVSEFARDRSKPSGHKSHCKACDNAKSKRYNAANRERVLAKRAERNAELRESQAGPIVRRGRSKWRAISGPGGP